MQLTDEQILAIAVDAEPPFPWGIGSTRLTFLRAVHAVLAAHSAGAQTDSTGSLAFDYAHKLLSARLGTHDNSTQTDAARDVLAERARQVNVEGWTAQHDDEHDPGDLCAAGSAYALAASDKLNPHSQGDGDYGRNVPDMWPENWHTDWWKLTTPRRDLIKAAALILAEIERLDRAKGE